MKSSILIKIAFKALTLRSLSLLWDLFRDERLCVELMDAALDAHYSIIESVTRADDVRREYIHKCIEELLTDSGSSCRPEL